MDKVDEKHGGDHMSTGRKMTDAEMKKREDIKKGLMKSKSDFKDRYGKDADQVMNALATKKAMEANEAMSRAQQAAIAISKKERGEKPKNEAVTQDDHGEKQNAKKVKDYTDPKKGEKKPFKSLRAETKMIKLGDKGKTDTGKDAAVIDVEPSSKPI